MEQDIVKMLEDYDKKMTEMDKYDPWLIYVADKGENICQKCLENHGKRFRESDQSRPALPIHPNCKCKYEKLDKETAQKVIMRSATVRVDKSPGIGGIRISGIDDMLNKLEKTYPPGPLAELIISNHGGDPGRFPMGNEDDLIYLSVSQITRLKKLLSPNAIIDIRMCHGFTKDSVQKIANKLGCLVRAYAGQVSPLGTRSLTSYDDSKGIPFYERFVVDPKGQTLSPEK